MKICKLAMCEYTVANFKVPWRATRPVGLLNTSDLYHQYCQKGRRSLKSLGAKIGEGSIVQSDKKSTNYDLGTAHTSPPLGIVKIGSASSLWLKTVPRVAASVPMKKRKRRRKRYKWRKLKRKRVRKMYALCISFKRFTITCLVRWFEILVL